MNRRPESTDATPGIVRNRQTTGAQSSGRSFCPSCHFSRQNGERGGSRSRISGYPADFPAIFRDRGSSGDSSLPTGEKRTQIWTSCPVSTSPETYRPTTEIVEELKVIKAEARETDRALRKILEQLGVAK
jgi:hypothetical protein